MQKAKIQHNEWLIPQGILAQKKLITDFFTMEYYSFKPTKYLINQWLYGITKMRFLAQISARV